ncbi:MAG: biotin/lipoyl-containing protein [Gallionella sp.]|nr:biotin/lipoyl-containing protein [Gallionella sp.]
MNTLVRMPSLNANEDQAIVTDWLVEDGAPVSRGTEICIVESTKATHDVSAEEGGFLRHLVSKGQVVKNNQPLAVITATSNEDYTAYLAALEQAESVTSNRRWTKKAELVAKKIGVDLNALAGRIPDRVISEADVLAFNKTAFEGTDLLEDAHPSLRPQRILLIGGGGGGGSVTLDAISRVRHQRAVGILDNNAALHGKTMMGVPIIGPNSMAAELWTNGSFDAAIICVTGKIDDRAAIFDSLKEQGIRFANVIDPSTVVKSYVSMGEGNLIMGNGYLAPSCTLGDNNFLASHACIEHDSKVGSHCTFGPRTTTSGAVTIGDRVKFGMGVLIEPYLIIGDNSLIPSGCVLTNNVPPNSVIKVQHSQTIKGRD